MPSAQRRGAIPGRGGWRRWVAVIVVGVSACVVPATTLTLVELISTPAGGAHRAGPGHPGTGDPHPSGSVSGHAPSDASHPGGTTGSHAPIADAPGAWASRRLPALTGISSTQASPSTRATNEATTFVVFQNVGRGQDYAKVAFADARSANGGRTIANLVCERVAFAGGVGICLVPARGSPGSEAIIFGPDFVPRVALGLPGSPLRARVSADGRYGAATVITGAPSGEQHDESAGVPTDTILLDMRTGAVIASLDKFAVTLDGVPLAGDISVAAVTFEPYSDRFFASIHSGHGSLIAEGDIPGHLMNVLGESLEDPSLSADGTRIAVRRLASANGPTFQLVVLDVATGTEESATGPLNLEDQPVWLDNDHLLYGAGSSIWITPIDGRQPLAVYLSDGLSPSAVRGQQFAVR